MTKESDVAKLAAHIRDVPDFPRAGILFKDISPLLQDAASLRVAVRAMAAPFAGRKIDVVVGIESRGFIFGAPVALELGAGFALARKQGKLPWQTRRESYQLEYGQDRLEMHKDAVGEGHNVLIVDDLLATGGTARATVDLVRQLGGDVHGVSFLIELVALNGRTKLEGENVRAVLQY